MKKVLMTMGIWEKRWQKDFSDHVDGPRGWKKR
jgi:hypothetical protein